MALKVAVVLFLWIVALIDVARCDCNETVIDACIAPLTTPDTDLDLTGFPVLLKEFNSTTMITVCNTLTTVSNCLKTKTTCNNGDFLLAKWRGINDSISYLCNEGKAGLAQFESNCFLNTSYSLNASKCSERVQSSALAAQDKVLNYGRMCKLSSSLMYCVVTSATTNCNMGDFVATYYKKSQQPTLALISGCTLAPIDLSNSTCKYENLTQCTIPVAGDNYSPVTEFTNTSINLASVCSALAAAKTCLSGVAGCDTDDVRGINLNWISAGDTWSYICTNEGQVAYQKCFLNSTLTTTVNDCNVPVTNLNNPCQVFQTLVTCYVRTAKFVCEDATEFVANVFLRALGPSARAINCNLTYCSYANLAQCTIPVAGPDYNPVDDFFNTSINLASKCSALTTAKNCMNAAAGCDNTDKNVDLNWVSANESWSYICTKEGQAQYQKCSLSPTLQNSINSSCDIGSVTCQNLTTFVKCAAKAAKLACDSEQFVANVYLKAFNAYAKLISCSLSYNAPPSLSGTTSLVSNLNGIILSTILLSLYLGHSDHGHLTKLMWA